jgi:mRNA interferase RelE/StbE
VKIQFKASFGEDLRGIHDNALLARIKETIGIVEKTQSLSDIPNLKKIQGGVNYYRVRIGEFRIEMKVEDDAVTFIRCLNRRDVYKYFP